MSEEKTIKPGLRIPYTMYKLIVAKAEHNGNSINTEILIAISKHVLGIKS